MQIAINSATFWQSFRAISQMKLLQSFVPHQSIIGIYYNTLSQYQRADETQILNSALTDSGFEHV